MDVNRAEGHSWRVLAAVVVWTHGRRGGWLGALGLQFPPRPHFPVVHLQQDQNHGEDDDDNDHNGSNNGSRTLIQEVFSPGGHVQGEEGGIPQRGGCGHLDPPSHGCSFWAPLPCPPLGTGFMFTVPLDPYQTPFYFTSRVTEALRD